MIELHWKIENASETLVVSHRADPVRFLDPPRKGVRTEEFWNSYLWIVLLLSGFLGGLLSLDTFGVITLPRF